MLFVIIFIIAVSSSCNNDNQQTKDLVLPERVEIEVADNANWIDDFNESLKKGDFRFIGIMGYSLIVPSVSDYHEKFSKSNGVKIIAGTSDSYSDTEELEKSEFYKTYAKEYNNLLLEFLSSEEK